MIKLECEERTFKVQEAEMVAVSQIQMTATFSLQDFASSEYQMSQEVKFSPRFSNHPFISMAQICLKSYLSS